MTFLAVLEQKIFRWRTYILWYEVLVYKSISLSIHYFEEVILMVSFIFCFFGQTFRNNLNKVSEIPNS